MHKRFDIRQASGGMLLRGTSQCSMALLFVLAAAPSAAFAQAAESAPGLEDIVVTAQKREENLQAIPVAVTAITRASLENLQVQNFNNLSGIAPNVTAVQSVSGSNPTITIRGITGGNVELGKDSGVALYVDGVYVARATGAGFDVADLDRVEVLRGPQGTLYGRNATGGAINYITLAPRGRFYARQEATVGSLGAFRTKTRIDLPRLGAFSIALNYLHDQRDGYVRNSAAGRTYDFSTATAGGPLHVGEKTSVGRLGARNSEAGQIAVRFAPEAIPLTVDYKFDATDAINTNRAQQVLLDQSGLTSFRSVQPTLERQSSVPMGFSTPEHLKIFGHNLTAVLAITDDVQFKSVTGYRGYTTEFSQDVLGGGLENSVLAPAGGTYDLLGILDTERDRTFSQEVQLSYSSDLLSAIGGLYYFKQHTTTLNPLYFFQALPGANSGPLPASVAPSQGDIHNKSIAAFGQVTIHATDRVDVTGGVRGTRDTRRKEDIIGPANPFKARFKHLDWTANVTFRPTSDVTAYAKAGTGYISGGINTAVPVPYKPEKLMQYEIGAKTEWFDRRLRLNVAGFRSIYRDLQTSVNDPNSGLFITGNAGRARITGVEVELTALPVDNLTLNANYGYSKFKYKSYELNGVDVTHIANPTFYRPTQNLSLNAQYDLPELANGAKPSININGRWHSNMSLYLLPAASSFTAATPVALAELAAIDRFTRNNAVWDIDARASIAEVPFSSSVRGRFSLWMRNLLDKRTLTNATAVSAFGVVTGQYHEPRTYGGDFSIEF